MPDEQQPSTLDSRPSTLDSRPSTQDDDVLVRVENVSKRFCRDLKRSLIYGVQDIACDLLGRDRSESALRKDEFYANRGISFELRRGECLGLIGHNGAGKTTLLKMLNGLIKPDTGKIEMRGRIGALIALGAGFNPILTGRENVYIAGSVLGLSKKEIDDKYNEIVGFSKLEEFMESPVQNYSSGMQVRLGFAVATSMDPDILIIDEVLAVGDADFKVSCINKISKMLPNCAVLFVSHNELQVKRLATQVMLLDRGSPKEYSSDTSAVFAAYHGLSKTGKSTQWICDGVELLMAEDSANTASIELKSNDVFNFCFRIKLNESVATSARVALLFIGQSGDVVYALEQSLILEHEGEWQIRVRSNKGLPLNTGKFTINLLLYDNVRKKVMLQGLNVNTVSVVNERLTKAIVVEDAECEIEKII